MEQFRWLCCSWRWYRKLCKTIQKDQTTIFYIAIQNQGLFHAITQQCTDILTESKQEGPKTWNHKLARCRILLVCSKRICYTNYLLGGLRQSCRNCASHTIHSKSLLHMVYIYYIWMNYTFTSIYFQDFLCQSYRRKKTGFFFTFVPKLIL